MQFIPELNLDHSADNDAPFASARKLCIELLRVRHDSDLIMAVVQNPEYQELLAAKVRVYVKGRHYNTITPCGRCWYSSFFSSLAITADDDLESTFCIRLNESQEQLDKFYQWLDWFEGSAGYQQFQHRSDRSGHFSKYEQMKSHTSRMHTGSEAPLPEEFWGGTEMLFFHPLFITATQHATANPGPQVSDDNQPPLQNKAFLLFLYDRSNLKHFFVGLVCYC